MCLLGSVIIVLHAPPDKEIETIERMLEFALQPGMSGPCYTILDPLLTAMVTCRLLNLLGRGLDIFYRYDISSGPALRQEEPAYIHLDLLHRRIHHRHVSQGIRDCLEIDTRRE